MEQFERKAPLVIAVFFLVAATGGTLWYLHEQQQTETQQAVEQTRQVFERLGRDGTTVADGSGDTAQTAGATPAAGRRIASSNLRRSDVSGPLDMTDGPASGSNVRLTDRLDARYLLAALLCVAIVAAGLAGASFRLASRERQARRDGERLARDLDAARARIYAAGLSGQAGAESERIDEQPHDLPSGIVRAPIPTIVYSPQGDVIALNKAFMDALGYTRTDIPDVRTWLARGRRLPPARVAEALESVRRKFEAGEPVMPEEVPVWTRDGNERQWLFQGLDVTALPDGRMVLVARAFDVTPFHQEHIRLNSELEELRQTLTATRSEAEVTTTSLKREHDENLRSRVAESHSHAARIAALQSELKSRDDALTVAARSTGELQARLEAHQRTHEEELSRRDRETARPKQADAELAGTREALRQSQVALEKLKATHENEIAELKNRIEEQAPSDTRSGTPAQITSDLISRTLAGLPCPICVKDAEGRYLHANAAFEALTGVPFERLRGRTVHEALPRTVADALSIQETPEETGNGNTGRELVWPETGRHHRMHRVPLMDAKNREIANAFVLIDIADHRETEHALQDRVLWLEALLAAAPVASLCLRKGSIIEANLSSQRLLGEATSMEPLLEDVPAWQAWTRDGSCASGVPLPARIRRGTSWIDVDMHGARVETPACDSILIQIVDRTVTQQSLAKAAQAESSWRGIADEAPGMVWTSDAGGMRTWTSRRWLAHTGARSESGTGYGWLQQVHPEDRQRLRDQFTRAHDAFSVSYRLLVADGGFRWVEDSAQPRHSPGGAVTGYVGCTHDISRHRAIEQALRESEEKLRTITNQAPAYLWYRGVSGSGFLNKPLLDLLPGTVATEPDPDWTCLIHPGDREQLRKALAEAFGRQEAYTARVRMKPPRGALRWIEVRAAPLIAGDGAFQGHIGVNVEIGDLQALETRLAGEQRAHEAAVQKLDAQSHELAVAEKSLQDLRTALSAQAAARETAEVSVRDTARALEQAKSRVDSLTMERDESRQALIDTERRSKALEREREQAEKIATKARQSFQEAVERQTSVLHLLTQPQGEALQPLRLRVEMLKSLFPEREPVQRSAERVSTELTKVDRLLGELFATARTSGP